MDHFCKNHPDVKTRKKCVYCQGYICTACQRPFMGKPFCSFSCYALAIIKESIAFFRKSESTTLKKPFFLRANILVHLFYITLFIVIWLSIRNLATRVSDLGDRPPIISAEVDSQSVALSVEPMPDAMVSENIIEINGEADDNIIVSLMINGRVEAVTISKNNRFNFENIRLARGNNEMVIRGIDVDGRIAILEKIVTFHGKPRISFIARDVTRGDPNLPKIALTFDGGSGNGYTNRILDLLAEKGLRCTMFLSGGFIRRYPDEVRRMVQDGHEIGNHSWSHPHLTTYTENNRHDTLPNITSEKLQEELQKTADLFKKVTGAQMATLWRSPFGEHNAEIRQWAAELGYTHVGWTLGKGENMDTFDWVADEQNTLYRSSGEILQKILNFGRNRQHGSNGGIILMHLDTRRKKDLPHEIIPALIDSMHARGYEFVRISEMMD